MTYRSTTGLGAAPLRGLGASAPSLTDPAYAYLTKAVIAQGGCTPQIQANMNAIPCLNSQFMQWFGRCLSGPTPAGVTDTEWAAGCLSMANCGGFAKLGCPADAPNMSGVPTCLTDAQYAEVGPIIDYCRVTPNFDGPNKSANAICWGVSRYPDVHQKFMTLPRCTPPVTAASPVATPPAVTMAPPATATPSADTPTMVPVDEPSMTDTMTDVPVVASAGMSTTTMALIGVGGVVALGLGYMLLKKK